MIRIISGSLKGKALKVLNSDSVRPTTNRVRESIFNLLNSYLYKNELSLNDSFVLDIFAGSGGLGIEALSRGADYVLFSDCNAKVLQILQNNLETVQIEKEKYAITKVNICNKLALAKKTANIAFFDPPYNKGIMQRAYNNLLQYKWIDKDTTIIYECSTNESLPKLDLHEWSVIKKYGNTIIAIG